MKKICLLLLGIFCLVLTGCGTSKESREVGSISNFNNVATSNNFIVSDNMNNYQTIDYINEASIATSGNTTVEMIVYSDSDKASKVQEEHINNFKVTKSTGATEHKEKGENYYKFWMVSNGYYMVSSRIDNTLVFAKTLLENKEKVENILNSMGY